MSKWQSCSTSVPLQQPQAPCVNKQGMNRGVSALERHQSHSHLRGHGGHRNAFHFHPGKIIVIPNAIGICSLFFLPFFFSPYPVLFLLPSSNILPSSPSFSKSDSEATPHLSKAVFQMTFTWQVVCTLISRTLSICPATSEMKEEVYLYLSSTSVFPSTSQPVKKTSCSHYPSASSLFHPFIISPWPHVVVSPPVCFSPAWPTFLKWGSMLLSVTWKHISQNRAERETQLEHVKTSCSSAIKWINPILKLWCDTRNVCHIVHCDPET